MANELRRRVFLSVTGGARCLRLRRERQQGRGTWWCPAAAGGGGGSRGMKGTVSHELALPVSPEEVWEIYGSLRLGQLAAELIPSVFQKVELEQGDGGEGTVVRVFFPSADGSPEPMLYKEKFTRVDLEKRVKEAENVEGGYLDLGFRKFLVRLEVLGGSTPRSCVVRSTVEYDVREGFEGNAGLASADGLAALAAAVGSFLTRPDAERTR